MQNHFELFGLEPSFTIDALALERAYRGIQSRIHPDRFAEAGDAERRASLQWSTRVNEAYATLREPLKRARYLLEMRGAALGEGAGSRLAPEFLGEQIERREALDAAARARDLEALQGLRRNLRARRGHLEAELAGSMDDSTAQGRAVELLHALQFLDKESAEIDAALESIEG